jgi:hypothetical protein
MNRSAKQGTAKQFNAAQSKYTTKNRNKKMAIQTLAVKFTGIDSLLQNNPQMSDPLNKYSKEMKTLSGKRKKTDDDILGMRQIELRAKIYWDDKVGIYVPSTWVTASIQGMSWAKAKIKKADIRASVFAKEPKIKLHYDDMALVKTPIDIVNNDVFHHVASLPQGQVRVVKATPIFNNWWFECELDFDDTIINARELQDLIRIGAIQGGFGDFRPTFGRANVEFIG